MTVLLPCCTFLRVFDTSPEREVLTLPELMSALRRFDIKPETASKIERDIAKIRAAEQRLRDGQLVRGRFMGKLFKAANVAKQAGVPEALALSQAADKMVRDAEKSAKRDLRLWSPALYPSDVEKRGADGVTHVSCLVLDYDDGTSIQEASTTWSSWFHLVYTTWSHLPDAPRFRLVLPLSFPVPSARWETVWSWAEEHAHFSIDPALKSPAATYALPVVRDRRWPREAFCRPGVILDPVDEGLLSARTVLDLEPRRPAHGKPSAIRGEDPDHEYVDHVDPDAIYFAAEAWEELDWEASPELVEAAQSQASRNPPDADPPLPDPRPSEPLPPEPLPPEPLPPEQAPLVGTLERLAELRRRGVLTEREFALAKAAVLRPAEQAQPAGLRVAVRFEGVLHDAITPEDAWTVAGPPVAGAIEWLERLSTCYSVLIVSPRNRSPGAVSVMRAWLGRHGLSREVAARLVFPSEYPEAALYVGRSHLRVSGDLPSLEELDLVIKTTPELVS